MEVPGNIFFITDSGLHAQWTWQMQAERGYVTGLVWGRDGDQKAILSSALGDSADHIIRLHPRHAEHWKAQDLH